MASVIGKTIREAMDEAVAMLKEAGREAPAVDAGVLLCHVVKKDKGYLYAHPEEVLEEKAAALFREAVEKRAAGVPVQYLTGHCGFMSLDFLVTPDVLIPRQDTEVLVEMVLGWINPGLVQTQPGPVPMKTDFTWRKPADAPAVILDMGTGSGCIVVSLAYYLKDAYFVAVDISRKALEVARANARKNGVSNRIRFMQSDLFAGIDSMALSGDSSKNMASMVYNRWVFDAIVCNPPYIPAGDIEKLQPEVGVYEPRVALDGGRDGLDFYRAIVREAPRFLKPGGLLAFEVGIRQARVVAGLMRDNFSGIVIVKDLGGVERVVCGNLN